MRGQKMDLGAFFKQVDAEAAAKKAGAPLNFAGAVRAGAGARVVVAPPPPMIPTRFGADCSQLDWDNALIVELVALAGRPARFRASGLVDHGSSGATQYWSFTAEWVRSGTIAADGLLSSTVPGRLAEFVSGTLQLHYHPHARPTDNYLHIKKSDGSDPRAGEFKNTHWLVAAIGLTQAALTPDGT